MAKVMDALIETLEHLEPAESIDKSLALVLKAKAEEKRRYFRSLAEYYERRYGMPPEKFYALKIEGKDHSWEDEESYFDWVTATQMAEEMEQEISKLGEILAQC